MHNDSSPSPAPGFSLIELLIVLVIIGILAALAIPALTLVTRARSISDAADQLAAAVELARSEAIARRTYVWLGIQTNRSAGGSHELAVGLVFSKDGTSNMNATNLQPLGRTMKLEGLGVASPTAAPGSPTDLTTRQPSGSFSIGASQFSHFLLTFMPMGELSTNASPGRMDGFTPRVAVGLRTMRGDSPDDNNPVDLLIEGSTGLPSVHRP